MNQATTSLRQKPVTRPASAADIYTKPAPGCGPVTAFLLRLSTRPHFASLRLLLVAIGGLGFSALAFGVVGMLPGAGILYAGALAATASLAASGFAFFSKTTAAAVAHLAIAATVFALAVTGTAGSITGALMLVGAWTLAFGIRQSDEPTDYGLAPLMVALGSFLLATGTIGLVAVV